MLELNPEDLLERCEHCKGTGDLQDSTPRFFPDFGSINMDPCQECKGQGAKPTLTGELIRGFVIWMKRTGQI